MVVGSVPREEDRRLAMTGLVVGVVALGLSLVGTILWAASGFIALPMAFAPGAGENLLASVIGALFAVVGLALTTQRPDNAVGWVCTGIGLIQGLRTLAAGVFAYSLVQSPASLATAHELLWLAGTLVLPGSVLLATLGLLVFPEGRIDTRGWRVGAIAALAAGSLASVTAFRPGPLPMFPDVLNPHGLSVPPTALTVTAALASIVLAGCLLLGAMMLWRRYREAGEIERLQIRWFLYAGALMALLFAAMVIAQALLRDNEALNRVLLYAFIASGVFVPFSILIAVQRYRLYEIDVIISRTFVFGSLAAILAGCYAAAIRLFQWLFVEITGDTSDGAIVLTTLLLATLFTPLKQRLEGVARRTLLEPAVEPAPPEVPEATDSSPARLARLERRLDALEAALARSAPADPDPSSAEDRL